MPAKARPAVNPRHALGRHAQRAIVPAAPSVDAQCRAVVARLNQLARTEADDDVQDVVVDTGALGRLPDPTGWNGNSLIPWGHPLAQGETSRDVVPVRAGRRGWYFRYEGALYDTMRDAFTAARLRKPVTTPWFTSRWGHECGCVTVAARHVAIQGTVEVEEQLELMRKTLRHVALAAPDIDLGALSADLFADQRVLAQHYLLGLEADGFVDHAHEDTQESLMLTKEGCSALLMLELTRSELNEDELSPEAMAAVADEIEEQMRPLRRIRSRADTGDIPRFLTR